MKKSYLFVKYLVLLLLLNSCLGSGVGDISDELGSGYCYLAEGSCSRIYSNFIFKEGIYPNIKRYSFDKKFIIVEQSPSMKNVKSYLVQDLRNKYGFLLYMKDSIKMTKNVKEFMQSKIWKDSIWHKEISKEILPENNVRNFDSLNNIASRILKEDINFKKMFRNKTNYYIIEKETDSIFGPLTLKEFKVLKKEKKIDLEFE